MRNYLTILLALFLFSNIYAQKWTENLPNEKSSNSYTFYDYQNAFNSYWGPLGVENGYFVDEKGNQKKALGWRQFKRWEHYWETRKDKETGQLMQKDLTALFKQEKRNSSFKTSTELWVSLGPNSSDGGYAGIGRINTIAFHPTNPDIFWAGTASGGLWTTEDGGSSWTVLNDDMQALGVSDIIIPSDYETTKTIYLATGDRDAFDTPSIGLLKSVNSGSSWVSAGLDFYPYQNGWFYRAILNPEDNKTLVVSGNFGTYKNNGSISWSKISSEKFIDMEAKPGLFSTLYGSTKDGKVFVSDDGGDNWLQPLEVTDGKRVEMAVSPSQPDWVYAVVANTEYGLHSIHKSEDAGITFKKIFDGMAVNGNNLLGWDDGKDDGGQGWYDLAIAVSPIDANTIVIGGVNTWKSVDGGKNWEIANHWYGGFSAPEVHADKHFLGYQTSTGDLFEGNDGGIYKTSDYIDWTDLSNGITNSQIYRLGLSANNSKEALVGLQDNGTKLHLPSGAWKDVGGGDGMECIIDFTNAGIQYGSYNNGAIYKTKNNWFSGTTSITNNIPGNLEGAWVTPYIMNPKDSEILYVGYKGIWKTSDGGDSFSLISDSTGVNLQSLAISYADTNTLYAATYSKIIHTSDGGLNWEDISSGLPVDKEDITSIAVKHDDPNTLWVSMTGHNANGVFESTNAGISWTNITSGIPNIPCNSIVQNKLNTSKVELYVGTDIGVYLKDGDADWVYYSTGLPNVVIGELEIYYNSITPSQSKLKAATYGRGLWETFVYSGGTPTAIGNLNSILEEVYPNPSNGHFKIDVKEYDGKSIDIEVLSISGKLIYKSKLLSQSNKIDLGAISTGVYLLRIKKDNHWFGRNIIIQK